MCEVQGLGSGFYWVYLCVSFQDVDVEVVKSMTFDVGMKASASDKYIVSILRQRYGTVVISLCLFLINLLRFVQYLRSVVHARLSSVTMRFVISVSHSKNHWKMGHLNNGYVSQVLTVFVIVLLQPRKNSLVFACIVNCRATVKT